MCKCVFLCTLITGRNEVVAKVMFLHVSVILFTGGGLQAGRTPLDMENPPPPGQGDPPWTGRTPRQGGTPRAGRPPRAGRNPPGRVNPPWTRQPPPPGSRLQNAVYERPVRILLECILVCMLVLLRWLVSRIIDFVWKVWSYITVVWKS